MKLLSAEAEPDTPGEENPRSFGGAPATGCADMESGVESGFESGLGSGLVSTLALTTEAGGIGIGVTEIRVNSPGLDTEGACELRLGAEGWAECNWADCEAKGFDSI